MAISIKYYYLQRFWNDAWKSNLYNNDYFNICSVFPSHQQIVWYVLSKAVVNYWSYPCSLLRAFRPGYGSRILRQRCTITPVHLRVLSASRTIYFEITLSLVHIPCRSYHCHIFLYLSATHLKEHFTLFNEAFLQCWQFPFLVLRL